MKEALDQWASAQPSAHLPTHAHDDDMSTKNKPDNYNEIKTRYLRSLNIPIPSKQETQKENIIIASSAPIPIPIAMAKRYSSDEEDEEDDDYFEEPAVKPRRHTKGEESTRPKPFIPPHELVDQGNSNIINHSVPTNYKKRTAGGI